MDLCLGGSLCRVIPQCFARLHFHQPDQIYCPFCSSVLRKRNVIKNGLHPSLLLQIEPRVVKKIRVRVWEITRAVTLIPFLSPLQHRTHSSCLSFIYNDFGNSVSLATQPVTQPNPIKWLLMNFKQVLSPSSTCAMRHPTHLNPLPTRANHAEDGSPYRLCLSSPSLLPPFWLSKASPVTYA